MNIQSEELKMVARLLYCEMGMIGPMRLNDADRYLLPLIVFHMDRPD